MAANRLDRDPGRGTGANEVDLVDAEGLSQVGHVGRALD